MNIRRLILSPFMSYEQLDRTFPKTGVVVVVGPNGVGKSTLIEGCAWGLYGELVRGTTLKRPSKATVTFEHRGETYTVERTRDKRGKVDALLRAGFLELAGGSAGGVTVTETQKRIDSQIGDWRRFSCTQVFSKELMQRFGLATDKERKALLEGMLGLGQFDRALKVVREKQGEAERTATALELERVAIAGRLQGLTEQADEGQPADLPKLKADHAAAVEVLAAAIDRAKKADELRGKAALALAGARQEAETMQHDALREAAQVAKLRERLLARGELSACPVCLRDMEEQDRELVRQHIQKEMAAQQVVVDKLVAQVQVLRGDVEEVEAEWKVLTEASRTADAASRQALIAQQQAQAAETDALRQEKVRQQHAERQREVAEELKAKEQEATAALRETEVLGAAEEVLGLQGARNMLLGRALARLERATNFVLARLGGRRTYKVKISGSTTLKSDKQVDKVSIEVEGAGDGEYRGASGGEKARLDVALLLGLASLAPHDRDSTLFLDEVFDSLDHEGVEKVAAFLGEMALERQIVVITHNEDLAARFPQSSIWSIPIEGKLEAAA